MSKLHLEIVTPDRSFYNGKVERVIVRGLQGDFAVLKGRAPIATPLKICKVRILEEAGQEERIAAVVEGYITVLDDVVTIVTDAAEWPEEIDVERALAAKARAEERLKRRHEESVDAIRAEAALKRAINRLDLVK